VEKLEDSVCLDTDILIDLLRNKQEVVKWINENQEKVTLATTIINVFELYCGIYNYEFPEKKIEAVEELLSTLIILDLSLDIVQNASKEYGKLRKEGQLIGNEDLLIGATAFSAGFVLKTNNKKHFERIKGLKLI